MTREPSHEDKKDKDQTLAIWIAIGVGAGVALGAALGNLALWMAVGAGIGVAIGVLQAQVSLRTQRKGGLPKIEQGGSTIFESGSES